MPRITVSTQKYCSGPGGTRGPRSWKTKEHLFGLILIQRTRNIAVAWSDMVDRSSVTRRGWWWWWGGQECRSKLQQWYNKVTHQAEQQTTKQTCPTFYSPACLLLALRCRLLQWHLIRKSQRCCLKWDDCTRVCMCVCVCVLADRTAGVL